MELIKHTPKPSLPPPMSSVGVVGWVRANLLSSPLNIALTAGALYLIALLLPPALNWGIFNATWEGEDNTVCTANPDGACWTFIKVRFIQLMFGLHFSGHPDQIWRPMLVLAVFVALLVPLLGTGFRHKAPLAIATVFLFPPLGFALIHGEWLGLEVARTSGWGGLMLTLILASVGIIAALPIGILLALGRRSKMPVVRTLSIVYIELWRGTPLITVLFMASVMLPLFFPSEVDFDKVARALFGLTMFQSAYTAEAIRGGLQALPKGQAEAGDALGMGYWQKTCLIVLPQALKISIPGIVNTFIELFKDTSLVLIIGLFDLLNMSVVASRSQEWKGLDLEAYIFAAAVYFLFCFGMSRYSQRLERELDTGHKT